MATTVKLKVPWACPKCGADANEHGKGGEDKCFHTTLHGRAAGACMGFICDCDGESGPDHGESYDDPCPEARCYHCDWNGTFPKPLKGLQAWEKKALEAGWSMPAERSAELILKSKGA